MAEQGSQQTIERAQSKLAPEYTPSQQLQGQGAQNTARQSAAISIVDELEEFYRIESYRNEIESSFPGL